MKKIITIICDVDTTTPHLLNEVDFEVIGTSRDDVWTMISKGFLEIDNRAKKEVEEKPSDK